MSFSKSILCAAAASALLMTACSKSGDQAAAPAPSAPVTTPAAEGMAPGGLTPEQRAAASKAAMEASAAMSFTKAPLMDPNTAELMALASMPGVSMETAQKIVDGRPFATPSAMHAAISEGMSEADLKALYSVMFVKVGLNSGDSADYMLVPTTLAPRKLAREFNEYRPYKTMDDFTREMAKYVSADEVTFLTRYVTLD